MREEELKDLKDAYWKLYDCREIILSTLPVMQRIAADKQCQKAVQTVQAIMDTIKIPDNDQNPKT